jgi:hypothetical protein
LKARFLRSINSSKIPTMLGNCIKLSLADGPKKVGEKRKGKVLRRLRSRNYFCLAYALALSKREKS